MNPNPPSSSAQPIPMQWNRLLSPIRWGEEDAEYQPQSRRTEFERDFDRLIFSAPFRRLQNKAQIFPLPGKIFVHNRLTHSLEVSCVGRSLGQYVTEGLEQKYGSMGFDHRQISSIVSAACLAHDLGNPPFGHSGERAIRAYFTQGEGKQWEEQVRQEGKPWEDFAYYEGNANTLRLLTHRFVGRRLGGFALTLSTLSSVVKYPWGSSRAPRTGKFGFFATEEDTYRQIAHKLGILARSDSPQEFVRHPLVFLVEAADDICYQIMDLEDAYKLKILSLQDTSELLLGFFEPSEKEQIVRKMEMVRDKNERIAYLRSKAINILTESCASAFLEHEEEILLGKLSTPLVGLIPSTPRTAYQTSSQVAKKEVYTAREVSDVEMAGHRIFSELISKVMHSLQHPDESYSKTLLANISSQYEIHEPSLYGQILTTLDYISGMTDVYALDLYRRITGMSLPAI